MQNQPFFSVVMPTRNRAKLLPFAIQSVLNQTFKDFEIVISDNFSDDQTPEIGKSFEDDRIKYFRSEKSLSIGDSWEFALSHAEGKYICFLSDDDAYAKIFLERVFQTINEENAEVVTAKLTPYYATDAEEYGRKIKANSLFIKPFDRKTHVLNRKEALTLLFSKFRLTAPIEEHKSVDIPQLVNSAYHSTLIKRVKNRVPNIFPVVAGDIYSSALFLNLAKTYCYINEPLYLHAIWDGSETGGNESLFEKNPQERILDYVPLKKFLSPFNYGANTILRAKSEWGKDFYEVPFDYSLYFIPLFSELKYLEAMKLGVSDELAEFEQVLSKQDKNVQKIVRSSLPNHSVIKNRIKSAFKNTGIGNTALKFKNRRLNILSGFSSIAQCGETIDESFLTEHMNK